MAIRPYELLPPLGIHYTDSRIYVWWSCWVWSLGSKVSQSV